MFNRSYAARIRSAHEDLAQSMEQHCEAARSKPADDDSKAALHGLQKRVAVAASVYQAVLAEMSAGANSKLYSS